MVENDESSFLDPLDDSITDEDRESAEEKAEELTDSDFKYTRSIYDRDPGAAEDRARERYQAAAYERTLAARENARKRRDYGLENDLMFEYANKLSDTAEGKRKTTGQISAEKELALLASAQRGLGRTRGRGSFDAAEALRLGGLAAQGVESEGGALIASAARQAQDAAGAQLEQLLISGQERAADKAMNMEMLKMQQEQASSSLWSSVLSGVLGAVGAVGGSFIGQPVAGGMLGAAAGKGFGEFIG